MSVTGSGLGRLVAERFARLGCKLVLWDISKEAADRTADELRQLDADVHSYTCDVANSDSVYRVANKALALCNLLQCFLFL